MTGCLIKEVTIKAAWQRYYKSSRSMNRLNAENFSTSKIPMELSQIFPEIVLSSKTDFKPSEFSLRRQGRRHEDLKFWWSPEVWKTLEAVNVKTCSKNLKSSSIRSLQVEGFICSNTSNAFKNETQNARFSNWVCDGARETYVPANQVPRSIWKPDGFW